MQKDINEDNAEENNFCVKINDVDERVVVNNKEAERLMTWKPVIKF